VTAALAAAGCGTHHAKSTAAARLQACVWQATDEARMTLVAAAYRAGRLGSADTIRKQVHALGPQPGFTATSFVRSDGTFVPWSSMSPAQQRTLNAWFESTPGVAEKVGEEKLSRAIDRAHDSCAQHPS
jgi:hypothetical protein